MTNHSLPLSILSSGYTSFTDDGLLFIIPPLYKLLCTSCKLSDNIMSFKTGQRLKKSFGFLQKPERAAAIGECGEGAFSTFRRAGKSGIV
jgi:hypothetical protein